MILDLLFQVVDRDFGGLAANKAIAQEAENAKLLPPENELTKCAHDQGKAAETAPPLFFNRKIHARDDPGRSALEKKKLASARSNLRNELNGARAGAHDGYVLAGEIDLVIPV